MKKDKDERKDIFGITSDYMKAGIDKLGRGFRKKEPNQPLPGLKKQPDPMKDQ